MVGTVDAEDVTSEAWARISRDIRSFHGDANDFRGWAATIVRHRAIDHLRRSRPTLSVSTEDMPDRPAADDTEKEVVEGISTASALALVSNLPPDQAQAVLLRVVMGLDAASAGKVLGKRPGAVRSAAHRGLRSLARQLRARSEGVPGGHRDTWLTAVLARSSSSPKGRLQAEGSRNLIPKGLLAPVHAPHA
jgi:RNA polymerase sigma-70 factor (ECF subfamily)